MRSSICMTSKVSAKRNGKILISMRARETSVRRNIASARSLTNTTPTICTSMKICLTLTVSAVAWLHTQVADYLSEWLESHKVNVSESTYEGYRLMIESQMAPFFREYGDLKVKDITGDEINDYYTRILREGLKGTTAQRHHALLHLAFKSAVKRRIIPSNPVEQADRPKAQ